MLKLVHYQQALVHMQHTLTVLSVYLEYTELLCGCDILMDHSEYLCLLSI